MAVKVGVNGFGRIGRNMVRAALLGNSDLEFVAVNDVTDAATLGHLLRHDSVHGAFPKPVEVQGKTLVVGGKKIEVLSVRDPKELPWKKLGVPWPTTRIVCRWLSAAARHQPYCQAK